MQHQTFLTQHQIMMIDVVMETPMAIGIATIVGKSQLVFFSISVAVSVDGISFEKKSSSKTSSSTIFSNFESSSVDSVVAVTGFSEFFNTLLKPNSRNAVTDSSDPLNAIANTSINQPVSETVSNLVELYKSMKNGDCLLPQAAMLQPQEREAFISFVNEGKVDINTAENLKSALKYTNCLYPQKLMNNPIAQ